MRLIRSSPMRPDLNELHIAWRGILISFEEPKQRTKRSPANPVAKPVDSK